MSDSPVRADLGDAALDAALLRWSADPVLAPVFAAPGGIVLVLDAGGGRVLHATKNAAALRAAIADEAGLVRDALRLPGQIRPAAMAEAGLRLTRLRLDSRGIARPTSCLVARATMADDAVLLVAPTEPLPRLRPPPSHPRADAVPMAAPEEALETAPEPEPTAVAPGRFVWRSNGEGVLTLVSGASTTVAAPLTGRSWRALGESGAVSGAALLAALEAGRTFRALPLTLAPPGSGLTVEIALSGTPTARPAQPFAGFSGFGVVLGHRRDPKPGEESVPPPPGGPPQHGPEARPPARPDQQAESDPACVGGVEAGPLPVEPVPQAIPLPDRSDATAAVAAGGEERVADGPAAEPADAPPSPAEVEAAPEETAKGAAQVAAKGVDLSTNEHAAFREIARALGARFAGDDEPEPAPALGRRGAVMAFPASAAPVAGTAIDAAIVSALDRLPAGVLVHRDRAILFVNRRFLGLAGYADRAAMQAAAGIEPLFGTAPPRAEGAGPDEPVTMTTGAGTLLALLVERSRVDWDGGPAELLLVRPAAQADRVRERIAQGLFEARDAARERDAQALLDHIEEGVVALDEAGRVLALNRSAASILSGEARELVGAALADLFSPESGPAVAVGLDEAREAGASGPCEAKPRVSSGAAPLRLRIARVSGAGAARFCATLREAALRPDATVEPGPEPDPGSEPDPTPRADPAPRDGAEAASRADFLARVRHEIRAPLDLIQGHAEALLSEPFGALGSERYRDVLRDIHASGEQVIGVVETLVDLARIEAGRIDLTFTDVRLNDVVSGCIALMQPQAARDRIVVRTSLSPDLMPLVADERSMRQATLAVIANAIRLTEAGGQVIVSTTTAERGEIAFRVRDTGSGMTQEEIESALDPFRGAGLPERGGAGLGLTLTKALVEANRGRFRITSRKNEGTLVEMLFPPPQALSA